MFKENSIRKALRKVGAERLHGPLTPQWFDRECFLYSSAGAYEMRAIMAALAIYDGAHALGEGWQREGGFFYFELGDNFAVAVPIAAKSKAVISMLGSNQEQVSEYDAVEILRATSIASAISKVMSGGSSASAETL